MFPLRLPPAMPKVTEDGKQTETERSEKLMLLPLWVTVVRPVQGMARMPLPVPVMVPLKVPE